MEPVVLWENDITVCRLCDGTGCDVCRGTGEQSFGRRLVGVQCMCGNELSDVGYVRLESGECPDCGTDLEHYVAEALAGDDAQEAIEAMVDDLIDRIWED